MIDLGVGLEHFLVVGAILFSIGIVGITCSRNNILTMIMSLELMFLGININFVSISYFLSDIHGQVFAIFIIGNIGVELAIGLALVINYFNHKKSIQVENCYQLEE